MHSYALAIWLRSGGSILLSGMEPMGKTGDLYLKVPPNMTGV